MKLKYGKEGNSITIENKNIIKNTKLRKNKKFY